MDEPARPWQSAPEASPAIAAPALAAVIGYSAGQWGIIALLFLVGVAIKASVLWWLYRDLRAHGRDPVKWLIVAILLDLPTLIVWLIVRPRAADREPVSPARPAEEGAAFQASPQPIIAPVPPRADPRVGATREVALTCPRCATRFVTVREAEGPMRVTCPNCGKAGRIG